MLAADPCLGAPGSVRLLWLPACLLLTKPLAYDCPQAHEPSTRPTRGTPHFRPRSPRVRKAEQPGHQWNEARKAGPGSLSLREW